MPRSRRTPRRGAALRQAEQALAEAAARAAGQSVAEAEAELATCEDAERVAVAAAAELSRLESGARPRSTPKPRRSPTRTRS